MSNTPKRPASKQSWADLTSDEDTKHPPTRHYYPVRRGPMPNQTPIPSQKGGSDDHGFEDYDDLVERDVTRVAEEKAVTIVKKDPEFKSFVKDLANALGKKPKVVGPGGKDGKGLVKRSKRRARGKAAKGWRAITAGQAVDYGHKAWNFITKYLNVEEKMFDTNQGPSIITTAGAVYNLSNIAQGDDYNNRTGNSVLTQKLEIRGQVVTSAVVASANQNQVMRLLVLRDKFRTSTSDPAASDVFEYTLSAYAPFSPMNHVQDVSYGRRFVVIHDELIQCASRWGTTISTTTTGNLDLLGRDAHSFHHVLPLHTHVVYQATAASDASDYNNALYVVAISNVTTDGPALTFSARLHFVDN